MATTVLSQPEAAEASAQRLRDPLVAWHLLSLDAPTVAAAWMCLFARAWHVPLAWTTEAALFVAVWMLYVADRLLDAASGAGRLEARHLFHQRHQRAFLVGMMVGGALLLPLLSSLPRAQLRVDVALAGALLLWLGLVHRCPGWRLPKELAVGLFFAAAVCVPELCAPAARGWTLLVAAGAFALLCTVNCLWIARWEADGDDPSPMTHGSLRVATALAMALALGLQATAGWALLLAAAGLLGLDALAGTRRLGGRELHRTRLRAAADLVLLTPLLVLACAR